MAQLQDSEHIPATTSPMLAFGNYVTPGLFDAEDQTSFLNARQGLYQLVSLALLRGFTDIHSSTCSVRQRWVSAADGQ